MNQSTLNLFSVSLSSADEGSLNIFYILYWTNHQIKNKKNNHGPVPKNDAHLHVRKYHVVFFFDLCVLTAVPSL